MRQKESRSDPLSTLPVEPVGNLSASATMATHSVNAGRSRLNRSSWRSLSRTTRGATVRPFAGMTMATVEWTFMGVRSAPMTVTS